MCGLWIVDLHPKANLPAKFERNLRDRLAHMFWFSQTCSLKYEPSDAKTDLMGNTAQCRKMHLKVGEFTHWCAWTTKLQTFVFQSNIGLSGQSKYVNRRENSKESTAASPIAARCCVPQLRSLQDTSRHFALLRANQTIQTRGFPLFKRPTISATGSDVLEALSVSSRKKLGVLG